MNDPSKSLGEFVGKEVVLDTRGTFVFMGTLESVDACFYVLAEADVHDGSEGASSKEIYVLEALKYGIRQNRHRVFVRTDEVISLSLLSDVIEY